MPIYMDVVAATTETVGKILARGGAATAPSCISVTTEGGNTASVSWGYGTAIVNLPTLPVDALLTRTEADQIVGYIAHECCHVLHTARHVWDAAVAAGARVQYWVNALEDVRIERVEIASGRFPNLRNLLAAVTDRHHFEALDEAKRRGHVIGAAVADAPYCALVLGRVAGGYAVPTAHALAAGMGAECSALVSYALRELDDCDDTQDVLVLARELVTMEAALPVPPPPPVDDQDDQGDQGQDGDQGDQGDQGDDQQGQDSPKGDQGDQDSPQGGQQGQQDPDGPKGDQDAQDDPQDDQGGQQGDQGGEGAPCATGDQQMGAVDLNADGLASIVDKIAARERMDPVAEKSAGAHKLATARSTVQDHNLDAERTDAQAKRVRTHLANKMRKRLPASGMLHGQIARLLVSDEIHRVTHHETSGRLDRRALCRMGTGALDVFSRRHETPGINTAVMVLIDGSGSMRLELDMNSTTRMDIAKTTALHIAEAAEAANGKVCVAAFFSPNRAGQGNGALVRVVKPWDATVRDRVLSLNSVRAGAFTPLSPAIIAAAGMMAEVTATRRIMLVLTDGSCDYGAEAVTAACRVAATMGVEVVGIGMDAAEVTRAFPPRYSVNVQDLDQLACTGLGVLVDMLEDTSPLGAD